MSDQVLYRREKQRDGDRCRTEPSEGEEALVDAIEEEMSTLTNDQVIYSRTKTKDGPMVWQETSAQEEVDMVLDSLQHKFGDNCLEVQTIQRIHKQEWQRNFDQKKNKLQQRSESSMHWKFEELEPFKQELRNKLLGDERVLDLRVYVGLDSNKIAKELGKTSFASTKTTNNWFARGHYVTQYPWYAARYGMGCYEPGGNGILDPRSKFAVGMEGRLLICRAVMSNVYPITRSCKEDHAIKDFDQAVQLSKPWSKWYNEKDDKANSMKAGYDAHFVRVKKTDTQMWSNFQACRDEDAMDADNLDIVDEIVILEEDQLLPEYLVFFAVREEQSEGVMLDMSLPRMLCKLYNCGIAGESSTTASRSSTVKGSDTPCKVSVLLAFAKNDLIEQNYMWGKRDDLRRKGFSVTNVEIEKSIDLYAAVCEHDPSLIYIEGTRSGEWPVPRRCKGMHLIEELVLRLEGKDVWSKWKGCVINASVAEKAIVENVCSKHPGKLHLLTWTEKPDGSDMDELWTLLFKVELSSVGYRSECPEVLQESFEQALIATVKQMPDMLVMAPTHQDPQDLCHPITKPCPRHPSQWGRLHERLLQRLELECQINGVESNLNQCSDAVSCSAMNVTNASIEVRVLSEPPIELPRNLDPEDLNSFEKGIHNTFPENVRGESIGFRGTGSIRLRMDIKAFDWLRNRLDTNDKPLYFDLPMAWGGGEVRVAKVFPGDTCWFEGVALAEDVPKVSNHFLKELSKGDEQEYRACRLNAIRSQAAFQEDGQLTVTIQSMGGECLWGPQAVERTDSVHKLLEHAAKAERKSIEDVKLVHKDHCLQHPQTLGTAGVQDNALLVAVFGQATNLCQRLADQERSGDAHEEILATRNELANLLRGVLKAREDTLGIAHPDTLSTLTTLSIVLQEMGNVKEAEPLMRRALESSEETLGPKHPDTLTSLSNYELLLRKMGNLKEAEPLMRRALESKEETLGPKHPGTLLSLSNYRMLLQEMGNKKKAASLLRSAR